MEVRETYAGEEVPEGHRTVLYKNNNKTETSRSMRHQINKEEIGKGGGKGEEILEHLSVMNNIVYIEYQFSQLCVCWTNILKVNKRRSF